MIPGSIALYSHKKLKNKERTAAGFKSWLPTQRTDLKLSALQRNSASSSGVDGLATHVGNPGIELQEQRTNANVVMCEGNLVVRAVIVCFGLSWV